MALTLQQSRYLKTVHSLTAVTIYCIILLDLTTEVTSYDFRINRKFEAEFYGNELLRNEKLFSSGRSMYISPHNGVSQGVVVEMYVYIESSTDTYLQIWRPRVLEKISGTFNLSLVGQKLLPGTHTGNYSIMLTPEERFLVEDGDMLGFTVDGAICPISTHFTKDPNIYHLRAILGTDGDLPQPGDTITFETLDMPYRFSYGVAVIPGFYNLSVVHLYERAEVLTDCGDMSHECEQICRAIDAIDDKYICGCSPGFLLNEDQRTCSDIDECEAENGKCEFNCTNTIGGYRCSCPGGFQLSSNHHSCIYLQASCENMQCGPDEKCLQGYRRAYCVGNEVMQTPSCTGAMAMSANATSDCALQMNCEQMMVLVIWCIFLSIVLFLLLVFLIRKVVRKTLEDEKEEHEATVRISEEQRPVVSSPVRSELSPEPYERSPPPFEQDSDAELAFML